MDITAVTDPVIEFKHKQLQGEFGVEELSVWYRTAPEEPWQLIEIYIYATNDWESASFKLPDPSATYQISFVGVGHNGEGLYVDDVRVGNEEGVGVGELTTVTASVSPNPTTGLVAIEANIANGEVVVFDLFGKQVASAMVEEGRAELDLGECAQGVYVARIIGANGSTTVKLVKE